MNLREMMLGVDLAILFEWFRGPDEIRKKPPEFSQNRPPLLGGTL